MLIIALLGKITEDFQKYAMVTSKAQFYHFGFEYVHETWQLGHIWPVLRFWMITTLRSPQGQQQGQTKVKVMQELEYQRKGYLAEIGHYGEGIKHELVAFYMTWSAEIAWGEEEMSYIYKIVEIK